jgi:O-methyltransferase
MTTDLAAFVRDVFGREDLPGHGMQRADHGDHLVRLLADVVRAKVAGDVVELGCNAGLTAVVLQATLDDLASDKRLHVYDSFEGLPPLSEHDGKTTYEPGSCAAPPEMLVANFRRFGRRLPVMHPGWFSQTLPRELPETIAYAHLDADLYDSTVEGLRHVYPRLARGGVIVLHDYFDPTTREGVPDGVRIEDHMALPGVHRAVVEFLADKPEKARVLLSNGVQSGQGWIRRE